MDYFERAQMFMILEELKGMKELYDVPMVYLEKWYRLTRNVKDVGIVMELIHDGVNAFKLEAALVAGVEVRVIDQMWSQLSVKEKEQSFNEVKKRNLAEIRGAKLPFAIYDEMHDYPINGGDQNEPRA